MYDGSFEIEKIRTQSEQIGCVLLEHRTALSGSTQDFTGLMDNDVYGSYEFEFKSIHDGGSSTRGLHMRISNDDGATWFTSGYSYRGISLATTVVAESDLSVDKILVCGTITSSNPCSGKVSIQTKDGLVITTSHARADTGYIIIGRRNIEANAIQFLLNTGNFQSSGEITVYGYKK